MIVVRLYHQSEFFVDIWSVWVFDLIYKSEIEIRTFLRTTTTMINSNTRFFNKSLISFRLDFAKIEMRNERFSNWFECESSSWKKTMISAKFWYLSDRRLARIDLMIANDLVISKVAADRLFWWSDDWMSSISELDWISLVDSTSLIDSIRNDLITVLRKSIDSDDKTILQVLFSISSNLNESIHFLFSRHINTSELIDRSWIEITIDLFRVFRTSIIWRSTRIFLISIIAFSIIITRWIIDEIEKFMTCMREYASKTSKMNINSSESIVSLITLTIIWRIISLLIVDSRFSKIIWYARRNSAWYRFITSIDQWASTSTALMIIVIEMTNWRNFLLAKFLSALINIWSKKLR
jgi:hypothetical protein